MVLATRLLWSLFGCLGFAAVAIGAYGAHGVTFGELDQSHFNTALLYHLTHLPAVGAALLLAVWKPSRLALGAAVLFVVGMFCFSGALYLSAFTGGATPTASAPFGGTAMMIGWLALGLAGARSVKRDT